MRNQEDTHRPNRVVLNLNNDRFQQAVEEEDVASLGSPALKLSIPQSRNSQKSVQEGEVSMQSCSDYHKVTNKVSL